MTGVPLTEPTPSIPASTTLDDVIGNASGKTRRQTVANLRIQLGFYPAGLVSALPAPGTAGIGAKGFVTDGTSATFGAAVVGGGANIVPVWCNGAGWFVG